MFFEMIAAFFFKLQSKNLQNCWQCFFGHKRLSWPYKDLFFDSANLIPLQQILLLPGRLHGVQEFVMKYITYKTKNNFRIWGRKYTHGFFFAFLCCQYLFIQYFLMMTVDSRANFIPNTCTNLWKYLKSSSPFFCDVCLIIWKKI